MFANRKNDCRRGRFNRASWQHRYIYVSELFRAKKAIEAAHQQIKGRVPLIVGVSALRTDDAVKFAQDAKSLGVTVGLLAPVSYTALTQDEVLSTTLVLLKIASCRSAFTTIREQRTLTSLMN